MIAAAIGAWFEHLAPRADPQAFVTEIARSSGLRETGETHAPNLMAEVTGIADGAAQDFETMFAWQLIDECWWYLDDREASGSDAAADGRERCSALAVNHQGRGFVAQTQDLDYHCDGTQVMLRYLDQSGLEILAPSLAGLLALNGINSAGLAVGITTLSQLPHSTSGVASGLLVPMLLRCATVDEALALLDRVPIASGNSFVIGSRDRSVAVRSPRMRWRCRRTATGRCTPITLWSRSPFTPTCVSITPWPGCASSTSGCDPTRRSRTWLRCMRAGRCARAGPVAGSR